MLSSAVRTTGRIRCGPCKAVRATARVAKPAPAQQNRIVRVNFFKFGKNGMGSQDAGIYSSQVRVSQRVLHAGCWSRGLARRAHGDPPRRIAWHSILPPPPVHAQASRSDYQSEDVEYYFNYMGCLAVEGTYDRMEAMLQAGGLLVLLLPGAAGCAARPPRLPATATRPEPRLPTSPRFPWSAGLEPIDVILLMAAAENDVPKLEELLGAGGQTDVAPHGAPPLGLAAAAVGPACVRTGWVHAGGPVAPAAPARRCCSRLTHARWAPGGVAPRRPPAYALAHAPWPTKATCLPARCRRQPPGQGQQWQDAP